MEVLDDEERERVFVFCRGVVGASILRVTLAEVTLRVVLSNKVDRVDLLDDAFATPPGMIVREARLVPLLEGVDTVRLCDAADRFLVAVLATSTVRFTGRDRFALLRVERLEDDWDWDGAGLEGVDAVDLLGRDLEDREDALGAVAAAGVFAGVDRLF